MVPIVHKGNPRESVVVQFTDAPTCASQAPRLPISHDTPPFQHHVQVSAPFRDSSRFLNGASNLRFTIKLIVSEIERISRMALF